MLEWNSSNKHIVTLNYDLQTREASLPWLKKPWNNWERFCYRCVILEVLSRLVVPPCYCNTSVDVIQMLKSENAPVIHVKPLLMPLGSTTATHHCTGKVWSLLKNDQAFPLWYLKFLRTVASNLALHVHFESCIFYFWLARAPFIFF